MEFDKSHNGLQLVGTILTFKEISQHFNTCLHHHFSIIAPSEPIMPLSHHTLHVVSSRIM